jgi:anti-sigma factor RsiW
MMSCKSHIRSLMADHLTDVASSDQHTVKPWFNGRLDFAPVEKDLTPQALSIRGDMSSIGPEEA